MRESDADRWIRKFAVDPVDVELVVPAPVLPVVLPVVGLEVGCAPARQALQVVYLAGAVEDVE